MAERARADPALARDVEGVTPAIWLGCTLLDLTSKQTAPVSLRALPPDHAPVFGSLADDAGRPLPLGDLGPGEVIVNGAARGALAVQVGDDLSCTVLGVPLRWRVAAISSGRELGAGQTVSLFLPLSALQESLGGAMGAQPDGQPNAINQLWIANRGDAISSAGRTDRVVEALRPVLVDAAASARVRELLGRPDLRAALAARRGNLPERTQQALSELLAAADAQVPPAGTGTGAPAAGEGAGFDRLLRSQAVRSALIGAARDTRDGGLVNDLGAALQRSTGFQAQPLKQQVLEIADRAGNVITTIFLLFSLLSIAAGLLLVFLIFSLLAAAALGAGHRPRPRHRPGAPDRHVRVRGRRLRPARRRPRRAGRAAVSRLLLALLIWWLQSGRLGFASMPGRWRRRSPGTAAPRSAVLAAALGLLLTVLTVTVAAWRVTRVTIVTAIRDLPDPPPAGRASPPGPGWTPARRRRPHRRRPRLGGDVPLRARGDRPDPLRRRRCGAPLRRPGRGRRSPACSWRATGPSPSTPRSDSACRAWPAGSRSSAWPGC